MRKLPPIALDLSACNGLGDLICATPTIKKLHEYYEKKVTIISKMPELFKNNPSVIESYKDSSIDKEYFEKNYLIHKSFYNVGKKNEFGVEMKHNMMDLRQFHAIHLGFMLQGNEMECYYRPTFENRFDDLPSKYVVIHPVQNWATRTWSSKNWSELVRLLNDSGIYVVAIGKESSERGFFNVEKPVFDIDIPLGKNLVNQTSIADSWHILNNSSCVVTMDSGILHLAGTTNTNIIQLGSHINPLFRAPYRNGSQSHKYFYVSGECKILCGSNAKYGIKEWGSIQGVAPLVKCLEGKETFECHPTIEQVFEIVKSTI